MDVGLSNRAVMPLPYYTARIDVVPVKDSVNTLMPQTDYAVASMAASERSAAWSAEYKRMMSEQDARAVDELRERLEREIEYDAADKALIFRVIDTRNGEVIVQTPNEAMLKLRAFFKEMGIDPFIRSQSETQDYPFGITGYPDQKTEPVDFPPWPMPSAASASEGTVLP